tara:strand:+ start:234 stop:488 length:255 start_codon:yes stop_codon:yes gene_type:complete
MENLETGDKVKWIEPMMCVPHPEGKTDRNGVILPVFRNTERTGIVMRGNSFSKVATVRPDGMGLPKDMPTYYDKQVKSENLTKI